MANALYLVRSRVGENIVIVCSYSYISFDIYIESKDTVSLNSRKPSVSLTQKIYQIISKFLFIIFIKFFISKSHGMQKFGVF
jgi:hypothetical protein